MQPPKKAEKPCLMGKSRLLFEKLNTFFRTIHFACDIISHIKREEGRPCGKRPGPSICSLPDQRPTPPGPSTFLPMGNTPMYPLAWRVRRAHFRALPGSIPNTRSPAALSRSRPSGGFTPSTPTCPAVCGRWRCPRIHTASSAAGWGACTGNGTVIITI